MTCYHPLTALKTPGGVVIQNAAHKHHDILGSKEGHYQKLQLPCGQCIGCRMRRASDWEIRIMHEASQHLENCFITLTYSDENLPVNNSLAHKHFQDFMKRLRWHNETEVRYYMCGEYGETTQRPHYHACLFNKNFRDRTPKGKSAGGQIYYDSAELRNLWPYGHVSVQDLTHETASYCARYIMKKQLGATASYNLITPEGEIIERDAEYNKMSLKPGIGTTWYNKYATDVHTHDYAITKGQKRAVPKYYDKLLKERNAQQHEYLKNTRVDKAKQHTADQTPQRLLTRETVHTAKMRNKLRNAT